VNTVIPGRISFPTGNWKPYKPRCPIYTMPLQPVSRSTLGRPETVARTIVFLQAGIRLTRRVTTVVVDRRLHQACSVVMVRIHEAGSGAAMPAESNIRTHGSCGSEGASARGAQAAGIGRRRACEGTCRRTC